MIIKRALYIFLSFFSTLYCIERFIEPASFTSVIDDLRTDRKTILDDTKWAMIESFEDTIQGKDLFFIGANYFPDVRLTSRIVQQRAALACAFRRSYMRFKLSQNHNIQTVSKRLVLKGYCFADVRRVDRETLHVFFTIHANVVRYVALHKRLQQDSVVRSTRGNLPAKYHDFVCL